MSLFAHACGFTFICQKIFDLSEAGLLGVHIPRLWCVVLSPDQLYDLGEFYLVP